jgi:guanylate kinase
LYVVAAPSGAGKTSLVKALMEREPRIRFSVSYTTRKPRPNEIEGRDYHFVTQERFEEMVARGEFPRARPGVRQLLRHRRSQPCKMALSNGEQLLLEIDWQGARQVRARLPDSAQHLHPAALARALEERLRARSTDSEAVIERRLRDAAQDHGALDEFDYVVVNDRFEQALAEDLLAIVEDGGADLRAGRGRKSRASPPELAACSARPSRRPPGSAPSVAWPIARPFLLCLQSL